MLKVAALIIGIDGWEQYTQPLIASLQQHEPLCQLVVIDNASVTPYPAAAYIHRTERLCYAAAINTAAQIAGECDWYIVLSNDVLCAGPFLWCFNELTNVVAGPHVCEVAGFRYFEGWCVFAHRTVWDVLGGWDENFKQASWEDVDFTISAIEHGFNAVHIPSLPFTHLDQKQRFNLTSDYWESEDANIAYFAQKHIKEEGTKRIYQKGAELLGKSKQAGQKTFSFGIRLPVDVVEVIDALAKSTDTTRSGIIRDALRVYLSRKASA